MELHTCQIAKYRKAPNFLDTTIKSGTKLFAPTWDMVQRHKAGTLSDDGYTELYYGLMRTSYTQNKEVWLNYLRQPTLTLGCYCPNGNFCHRYLLVDILSKVAKAHNIPFTYMGAIT